MTEIGLGDATARILGSVGQIGLWLQALGVIVILWIIFEIVSVTYNHRRMKEVYKIKEDMVRIESKIDNLLNKKKR